MNALHRAMNRLLLLVWLLAGCSPPQVVDLGQVLRGSMRVQGQEVLDFEVTATFERLAPEHLVEVRASQSQIQIFVDGERLSVASRTADNHRVIYWFGACR